MFVNPAFTLILYVYDVILYVFAITHNALTSFFMP